MEERHETIDDIAEMRVLTDGELTFTRTPGGFLSLRIGENEEYKRVAIQRAYPLSKPNQYITVREVNEKRENGKEIGVIPDLNKLSDDKIEMINEDLNLRYYTPRVLQVLSLKDEYGYIYMDVKCTAGLKKITVPNGSSNFVRISEERVLIIDMDGNRFEIPDYTLLDKRSIRLLETVI